MRALLRNGVPVTLNTDNPRTSRVTLPHEYELPAALSGLTSDELSAIARQSAAASFVTDGRS